MKILFITSSTTTHGGGSKSCLQMLRGLLSYGIEPLVVVPNNKGLYKILQQEGISCMSLRHPYRMSVYPSTSTWRDNTLFIPKLI